MAAIRRRDTKPELELRRALHGLGMRFRVDHRLDLPGGRARPDIAFTRRRVAIFVDGCFFHGCPEHGNRRSIKNAEYWVPKLEGNVVRDRRTDDALRDAGWTVVRIWEHEPLESAVEKVRSAVADAAV